MNDLGTLYRALQQEIPGAELKLDGPLAEGKPNWLDVLYLGRWVVVEWRPDQGFGVSLLKQVKEDPLEGLFAGPDFIFADWAEAKDHILSLLHAEAQPEPRRVAHG